MTAVVQDAYLEHHVAMEYKMPESYEQQRAAY